MIMSTAGSTAYSKASFGEGSGTIYLDNVICTGSESRLIDCSYDSDTSDCGHHEDAGVRCVPCKSIGTVTLRFGGEIAIVNSDA